VQSCSVLSEVLFGWLIKKMGDKYLEQRINMKICSGLERLNRVITGDGSAFHPGVLAQEIDRGPGTSR
jgi:putative component of toxin-antitoxin plasmid stabilization module